MFNATRDLCRKRRRSKACRDSRRSGHLNLQNLIAILFVGLQWCKELITLGDLIMWIRQGYLPFIGEYQRRWKTSVNWTTLHSIMDVVNDSIDFTETKYTLAMIFTRRTCKSASKPQTKCEHAIQKRADANARQYCVATQNRVRNSSVITAVFLSQAKQGY